MKRILFTFLFLVAFVAGYTQMQNNGGVITVENGAFLVIEGDYTSTNAGSIEIDGTVQLKGDFINNGGSVAVGSTGLLAFNGTAAQEITGSQSTTFYCPVEVNNAAGVALTNTATGNNQSLGSSLTLTSGKVTLNAFDLTLSSAGVTGATSGKYIVTNSTGQLKAPVVAADYVLPVGDATTYNPVTLNDVGGGADTYGVIYTGTSLIGATHSVLGNWAITEGTPGGANLTVTPQWNLTQEQASFDRLDCAVGVTTDNGTTVAWKASGAAAGGDPYTKSGAGFTGVGKFLVGDYWFSGILVDLDFWLAGPYAAGAMGTQLKTKNLIPLTDPYGLGNTVAAIPANVVDWIKVELRDKTNPATILYTKAFFLDNTGNVLYLDGTSGAKFTGIPKDQYYIAVKHRNHLGARTSATVDLTVAGPAFNYKSGVGVYTNPTITTYGPQATLATGVYGLYKGNVNGDTRVAKAGAAGINDMTALLNFMGASNAILNVYAGADVNCDGDARKAGASGINDMTHLLNSLGTFNTKLQHF